MRKWFKHKSVRYMVFILLFIAVAMIASWTYNFFNPGSVIMNCSTTYYATFSDSDARIGITYARTDEERSKGLMFVEEMSDDSGMYFVFDEDVLNGFWMKNTLIPLDMIFINSFMEIVDINENAQPCGDGECLSYIPSDEYKYVLEINGGLSEQYDIEIGDQVKIEEELDCPEFDGLEAN